MFLTDLLTFLVGYHVCLFQRKTSVHVSVSFVVSLCIFDQVYVHILFIWRTPFWSPGGCFTKVSRALQNNLAKIHNARNHIYGENFKLKLCTCAQSIALGSRTKFQLEILIKSTISVIHKFRENILESSRNLSETTPSPLKAEGLSGLILDLIPATARRRYKEK